MRFIVLFLSRLAHFSRSFPRSVVFSFLVLSIAGFATVPFLRIADDLTAGVGEHNPVISLTRENNDIFGEQDSLIIILEFPEPPGDARLPFIKGLGEAVARVPGVRRVRYQFIDPDDEQQTKVFFQQFLLGMNKQERSELLSILSEQGIENALRRNINRLFLTANPYVQKHMLEDPLELAQFIAKSMKSRVGSVSLGDTYLLIASPDSTIYLIQVTPEFASHDTAHGDELIKRLNKVIPATISSLEKTMPNSGARIEDVKWHLTGKMAFQQESGIIFDQESLTMVLCSFALVLLLLIGVYRDFWSVVLLMTPLAAGIGLNYGFMYVVCHEVNPVVMGATGVLLGLGTEYGEHLWGRIREELDRGANHTEAVTLAYEQTGPPVLLGAFTGMLAFLCLCLSDQPVLLQFGYLGASGLAFTLISTLLLVPALARIASARNTDHFPRIRIAFTFISTFFQKRPVAIVTVSGAVILASVYFASHISYEKDLFKVFLARDMQSTALSAKISRKFHSDFSRPTYLSFDVTDLEKGLIAQRELDRILQELIEKDHEIASFDSISYLIAPDYLRRENVKALTEALQSWPQLEQAFKDGLRTSSLSESASQSMLDAFEKTRGVLASLGELHNGQVDSTFADLERSWYMTEVRGKYRFLTHIRYPEGATDPEKLKETDARIMRAVEGLPVKVFMSGTRQAMDEILSGVVSELFRLGFYAFGAVVVIFLAVFPHPRGVGLCLIPMIGSFCVTLGVLGLAGLGLPFSMVCVAPLIFGFGIHNGMHVVMGSLFEEGGSIAKATTRVTPRSMVTSLTIIMGFISMLSSRHYSLEFLGIALVIGMIAAVPLTLATLPAVLLLLERLRTKRHNERDQAAA